MFMVYKISSMFISIGYREHPVWLLNNAKAYASLISVIVDMTNIHRHVLHNPTYNQNIELEYMLSNPAELKNLIGRLLLSLAASAKAS